MFTEFCEASGAAISAVLEQERAEIKNFALTPEEKISKEEKEILGIIRRDIAHAQEHLDELPESQRRGLTLETMRHFKFGYIYDWTHPKLQTRKALHANPNPHESSRIIIPTSPRHYHAVLIDKQRQFSDGKYWKMHAGRVELFCDDDALKADTVVVVEGEIDCASIWQATRGKVACCACPGGNKNHLLDALSKLEPTAAKEKKFLILFDNDEKEDGSNPGQANARRLLNALIDAGYPAVNKIFEDLPYADDDFSEAGKIDANFILQQKGNECLKNWVNFLIESSREDFVDAARKVIKRRAEREAEMKAALEKSRQAKAREVKTFRRDDDFDSKAEIERLIDAINSLDVNALESRGYLQHSEKGGARPNGYICPACGSGSKRNKSGALSFGENGGKNVFYCHVCNEGGDVLEFLARVYNLDTHGKDFFELLKRAAVDFSIACDERIFLPSVQSSNTKKTKAQKAQEAIDEMNEKRKDAQARLVELRNAPDTPENREEIRRLIWKLCDWHRDKRDHPTSIKPTVFNMDLILDNDKALRDIVGYNEFFGEMVVLKDLFWRKDSAGTEWTDRDEAQFRTYLRRNYCELKSPETIHDCLIDLSQRNAFHPVKDFFNSLPAWDGVKRAETLLIDFLKADDTPFTREVTLNWLTAAVARIFYPGVDYQLAPILLGQQGIGKSYLLNKLGGKWYGALFDDVNDPHAIDAIQRLWLCEIKEMASMKKDVDANKRFIDTAVDTRRAPYDRYPTATPRHCIFAITTNNRQCLTDMTGNRRYPVIECKAKPGEYVDGLNDKFISQLWAEVYRLFKEKFDGVRDIDSVGRGLELSREVKKQVLTTAETYTRDDGLESVIKGFLDTPILPPVLWKLLTREERRKFIADGKLVMENAMRDFNLRSHSRWQGKSRYDSNPDIDLIDKALKPTSSNTFVRVDEKKFGEKIFDVYTVYGSVLRQHISAAEIYEECFGNDRRKTPARIYEVLSQLDGWALGKRIRGDDPYYRDQKKVYYRQSTEDNEG